MIKVVMLDLGGTLEDGTQLFPFVPECLEALAKFTTAAGQPLEYCLVSDFHLADPFTEAEVARRFAQYLDILDGLALRTFFEPVDRRITLSSHVNVFKPDLAVFTKALARLGSDASLEDCLFITENAAHIAAAAGHGMSTIAFGDGTQQDGGFVSWPEGLILIANKITPGSSHNLEIALGVLAKARLELEDLHLVSEGGEQVLEATAKTWIQVNDPELDDLDGVNVQMPVSVQVSKTKPGEVDVVITQQPSQADVEEAQQFVKSLHQHKQIEGPDASPIGAPTHYVDTDAAGRRLLKRRGFR